MSPLVKQKRAKPKKMAKLTYCIDLSVHYADAQHFKTGLPSWSLRHSVCSCQGESENKLNGETHAS